MAKLISGTYGEALFGLALEENKLDIFYEEVVSLLEVLKQNDDFVKLLNHPKVVKDEKISLIENIFKGRVSDEIVGFFVLILKKDRFFDIEEILNYFVDKVKEEKKIGVVVVTTAVDVNDEAKQKIEGRILETTGYKTLEVSYRVDTALIGGMTIRIGDRVVDSSISNKLYELKKQLMNIQLG